jgi:hypothetical protein
MHCRLDATDHGGGKRWAGIRRQHAELALAFGVGAPENYDETFFLSIALSALVIVAVSASTQAAYYHHRHHHYWHHGGYPIAGYWNYYRTSWPGRGNNEESTR